MTTFVYARNGKIDLKHGWLMLTCIVVICAAAIVGRLFGRHKLQGWMIEGVKSVEGSAVMAVTSFACTLPVLLTLWGLDTVTVPIVSSVLLWAATLL